MLSRKEQPVSWAMFMHELADAHEHLGALIDQLEADPDIGEDDLAINLGHIYAHLNRAWHGRNDPHLDIVSAQQRVERSQFPTDLRPDQYPPQKTPN